MSSNTITKADLDVALHKTSKEIVEDVGQVIDILIARMDERFTKLEVRQDRMDIKLDRLVASIDRFVARIDQYETERSARDSQFNKLVEWAKKVSEKTGIPLENL